MERRLERLEEKVDRVEDVVVEIKTDLKHYNIKVEEHLVSDAGIIKAISPILEKLPQIVEIAEEFQLEKAMKAKKKESRKVIIANLGVVATVVAIITGITRLL